jgi:hypothetical protein
MAERGGEPAGRYGGAQFQLNAGRLQRGHAISLAAIGHGNDSCRQIGRECLRAHQREIYLSNSMTARLSPDPFVVVNANIY